MSAKKKPVAKTRPTTTKKAPTNKKVAAKKPAAKKAPARVVKKPSVAKKPAAKKKSAKPVAKKPVAKKPAAAKKPVAKKPAAKPAGSAASKRAASGLAHPVFGEIAAQPTDGILWQKTVTIANRDVSIELGTEAGRKPSVKMLDSVAPFVIQLAKFDDDARASLRRNFDSEGTDSTVGLYLDHHLEELPAVKIAAIFRKRKENVNIDTFFSSLFLSRVGLYPDKRRAVFDYTIGKEDTQYLLVVGFDGKGKVTSIDMES